ncbi:ephrin type-A receptor 3-like [Asterias rubens]|uniref:ephrin type-A receptor 3-like n=1 Tax=Asterias rubens TaxID=7604 RepID=UPI0014558F37|nr:ephrin type-A receptor 3-like [Asterias rubens]
MVGLFVSLVAILGLCNGAAYVPSCPPEEATLTHPDGTGIIEVSTTSATALVSYSLSYDDPFEAEVLECYPGVSPNYPCPANNRFPITFSYPGGGDGNPPPKMIKVFYEVWITTIPLVRSTPCEFYVRVLDSGKPVIGCPANIVMPGDEQGFTMKTVSWTTPVPTDNSNAAITLTSSIDPIISPAMFPVGVHNITYTAMDQSGNVNECTFTVTITDNEAPNVTCPTDNSPNVDASLAGAYVIWSVSPNATDVVDATVNADSVVCEDHLGNVVTSGEFFQDGLTKVTCRANDTSLNEGSCSFFINVTDTGDPVIECPANIVMLGDEQGFTMKTVSWTTPVPTDNSNAAITLTSSIDPLTPPIMFPIGFHQITYTAMDQSGNSASCSFNVTITEPVAPAPPSVPDDLLNSVTESSFKVVIEPVSQRYVPISCLELTLVQLNRNAVIDGKDPDIMYHPDQLGTYQEAQESMTPYVAVVFTGNEVTSTMEVEIGVGGTTSCDSLSRRKRRQSKREHIGDNGALRPNTKYTAFLRAYIVLENGMEVYSTSPLMQSIQTGETPSNNVVTFAVIGILSTLLIVAVAVIVLRSKVNRDSHTTQDTRAVDATVEMNPIGYEVKIGSSTEAAVYEDVGLPSWAVRWEILRCDLDVDDTVLGRGNFGEVRSGTVDQGGKRTKCAIKILKGLASPSDRKDFLEEFRTMTKIGYHPNIVSLIGACQDQDVLYVALEYLPNGDLRNHLRSSRPDTESEPSLTSDQLIKFALDVAMGMEHLASSAVIHRDLAARNILLGRGFVAKVADFGLSRGEDIYVQTSMKRVPTRWLSIESILHNVYTTKSDVWSFGILVWEIATLGGTPYPSIRTKDLASHLTDGYRMSKPQNCDEKIYTLMIQCWEENPTNRPSFSDLVTVLSGMNESQIKHTYMAFQRPHYENFSVIRPELDDN